MSWEFNTAVRRVQFSEDDKKILLITEPRMGFPATLQIFSIENGLTEPGMLAFLSCLHELQTEQDMHGIEHYKV